jgi:hypothetical protein
MSTRSEGNLKMLMEHHRGLCISLYLPTHREGAELQQDRIRLTHQMRQAENLLFLANVYTAEVEDLLEPIQTLVDDEAFWLHPSDGLALFRSQDVFDLYRLPSSFQELVVVSTHFYLKPLLPWLGTVSKPQHEAAAHYRNSAATERASNDIREVIPAAYDGRIESLFVSSDQEQWGTFDPVTRTMHVHRVAKFRDEDLLDLAATQTLLHGGAVYALEREHMPDATLIAAVFRHDPASKVEGKEEVTRSDTTIPTVSQAHSSVN